MSTLKLKGSSSGEAEVTVAAAAGTPTITLPTASINLATAGDDGQYLKTNGSGTLSFDTPSVITYKGTAVATTSGTSVEFTGIPVSATRLTLLLAQVSGSGTDNIKVQLGHSSAYYTSGYNSVGGWSGEGEGYSEIGLTDGFAVHNVHNGASNSLNLRMTFTKLNDTATGTSWIQDHQGANANVNLRFGGGILTSVSTAVDRLKVIFTGSDTFDAGAMQVTWEY